MSRMYPDSIYLEISEGSLVVNLSGKTRTAATVAVHWKPGRTWQRASFIATEDETLAALLHRVADGIDTLGIDGFITKIEEARR